MSASEYLTDFQSGNLRALGRLISAAENLEPSVFDVLAQIYPKTGKAKRIGITGPPGAGKSTLTSHFVRFLRESGKKVAVVAVDPMSPFTGGAILGDRIRLIDHFNDPGVFIRSLSTRGKLGGLSLATRQVVHLLDGFGFDYILIESVGVGQSEVDIRKLADVSLVVLVPESGDAVQALKAGILEIADFFVVNKADRDGAERVVTELKGMLEITHRQQTPVHATTSVKPETVLALFEAVQGYLASKQTEIKTKRDAANKETFVELLEQSVVEEVREWAGKQTASTPNPYQSLIDFRKKKPVGQLFK